MAREWFHQYWQKLLIGILFLLLFLFQLLPKILSLHK